MSPDVGWFLFFIIGCMMIHGVLIVGRGWSGWESIIFVIALIFIVHGIAQRI